MGKINWTAFGVFTLLAVLVIGMLGLYAMPKQTVVTSTTGEEVPSAGGNIVIGGGDCGQNPSPSISFVNALTGQSISTADAYDYKDVDTNQLLGVAPSLSKGQKVIPIINATGYIAEVQPQLDVPCGNFQIKGKLYQYANASITMYADSGVTKVGSATYASASKSGSVGNDSANTNTINNKIKLVGTTDKSTGRMFIVWEVSNTTSVQSATLKEYNSNTEIPSLTVPTCYTNNLTGTPYKVAWEIPALVDGAVKEYNLQTIPSNGRQIAGQAMLTIYSEADATDSLTGNILTSGICDTNNQAYYTNKMIQVFDYQV